ncbi:hypothetical protein SBA5_20005 [Candidatus Sulfotelmatomonas gaucii]|uniref:Uncharacterized protein n=1 Tax=Candidatus Sulfuritelmatomonas gaucii TaxID=2043161 RepID=A0A2N9L6Y1_9BACT|nr:hypothetical protein SBA5_20005 [Candidatus Sulfotelmatomonas gaucii]
MNHLLQDRPEAAYPHSGRVTGRSSLTQFWLYHKRGVS